MLHLFLWDYFYRCMQNSYLCTLGMDNWKGEMAGGGGTIFSHYSSLVLLVSRGPLIFVDKSGRTKGL